jgi:hypothetical protein
MADRFHTLTVCELVSEELSMVFIFLDAPMKFDLHLSLFHFLC